MAKYNPWNNIYAYVNGKRYGVPAAKAPKVAKPTPINTVYQPYKAPTVRAPINTVYQPYKAPAPTPAPHDIMNLVPPAGWLSQQKSSAKRINATLGRSSSNRTTIARRLLGRGSVDGIGGVKKPVAPVPPPVDPLKAIGGEYDKYIQDIYGGLNTTLTADRAQYATRSEALLNQLKGYYDQAATQANQINTKSQNDILDYAKRMGLQQAAPAALTDWAVTNEQIKAINQGARADSLATNDMIRSNYYDFLGNKIASGQGAMAQARASLNDIIAQAILTRTQAQQAAAAAAAARKSSGGSRRSSGRKSSGGGSSSGNLSGLAGTVSQTQAIKNQGLSDQAANDPYLRLASVSNDPMASKIISLGTRYHAFNPSTINTVFQPTVASTHYKTVDPRAIASAANYLVNAGKYGGAITSSSQVLKGKIKRG